MAKKSKKEVNPIYLAILTAVLSGILSISGFYYTSKIQTKSQLIQKRYEYKAIAYNTFLSAITKNKSPIIPQILSIGDLVRHVATDAEIQALEDKFESLVKLNYTYEISWQLESDFNVLRLHGSEKVKRYCDDILTILAHRQFSIDWSQYPKQLQLFRTKWIENQTEEAYGYELKVSDDERIMMILLSATYRNLIDQLRHELHD
jgi:hypothetical protein